MLLSNSGIIEYVQGRNADIVFPNGKHAVGKKINSVINDPQFLALVDGALKGNEFQHTITVKSYCFKVEGNLIEDNEGLGVLLTFIDITPERKTINDLLGKELRFRTLFSVASDAIFMMDSNAFIDCNDATLKIFNCNREQIVGQTPYRFSPEFQPDGRTSEESALEKIGAAMQGVPQFFDWQHVHYDGTPFDAEVSLNRIDIEERVYIQAIVRDVTDRKLSEKKIIESHDELAKVNIELDRFVYSVSHDLRAPISSLLGIVYLLRRETDPDNINELLNWQEKSLKRLDHFIEDIVDYSRNARQEIEQQEINLKLEIEDVIAQLHFMVNADRITTSIDIKNDSQCISDIKRLRVILNNLLSNAIKYADLTKNNPFINVRAKVTKEKISIKLQDNGIGIPADQLNKIFEMFYRATERGAGSGLGLYIVKEAVAKLNGTLEVKSVLYEGTTFTISIPNG